MILLVVFLVARQDRNKNPADFHDDKSKDQDPILDRVAPEDVTLPERDFLGDRSRGCDFGDTMLELSLSAEVVTPDGGHVANDPRDEEKGGGEVIAVVQVEDPFALEDPGDVTFEGVPHSRDQQAKEDENFEQVHREAGHGVEGLCIGKKGMYKKRASEG